jgi:hypothetical protein
MALEGALDLAGGAVNVAGDIDRDESNWSAQDAPRGVKLLNRQFSPLIARRIEHRFRTCDVERGNDDNRFVGFSSSGSNQRYEKTERHEKNAGNRHAMNPFCG